MLAAQINEYGDPSVVKVAEVEKPSPASGKVLIEVHAASLNPFDTSVREGYLKDFIPLMFPATLGGDIAGIVTQTGDDVTSLSAGDKVYGQANVVAGNSGAFAQFAVTSANEVGKIPVDLNYEEAAAMALVGISALQALTEHIDLKSGQKLFINGGGGAIGGVAIQIAKKIGAYVATTASEADLEFVKDLGADEVIDYKSQDFTKLLSEYDGILDTAGGEDFAKGERILKKGGVAVSMKGQADESRAKELGVTEISQQTRVTTARLDELSKLVKSGIKPPRIAKVFPLNQTGEAFKARETGGLQGKVVLSVK